MYNRNNVIDMISIGADQGLAYGSIRNAPQHVDVPRIVRKLISQQSAPVRNEVPENRSDSLRFFCNS
jgi:hypothetical protein